MTIVIQEQMVPLSVHPDGKILVGGTRVTLDTVIAAFRRGATAEEIVQQYPSLRLPDVYTVIGYYLDHEQDVETYLQERESQAALVRQENERRFDPRGIRERLLSRKN
jgi:uncharacterized protein (DUF433 family)